MPYATPAEMLQRYDARLLGDLASDSGTAVDAAGLLSNAVVASVLADASAAIDAAAYVGNRYTPEQMASLSDTAAAFVRRLCCDLSLIYFKRRRGRFDPEKDGALLKEVNATLDALRDGKDLLLLTDQSQAPASTPELVSPTVVSAGRGKMISSRTHNYYPVPRLYDQRR